MKLSPADAGLLVSQTGGFEHVKRRHYFFAAVDDKLKRAWTGEEGAGPAWSATIVTDAEGGSGQDIIYLTGFQPGGGEPDTVDARRYRWDAAQKTVIEAPSGPFYGVVAGNFASADAARAVQAQGCLADYSAVRASDLGLPGSRIVLAALTTQKSLAEAAVEKTDNCPAGMTRRMVEVKLPAARR